MERPTGKFAYIIITLKRQRRTSMKMFCLTLFGKNGGSALASLVNCGGEGVSWIAILKESRRYDIISFCLIHIARRHL